MINDVDLKEIEGHESEKVNKNFDRMCRYPNNGIGTVLWQNMERERRRRPRGGTPLYGLYGDVPLDRVWFLASLS